MYMYANINDKQSFECILASMVSPAIVKACHYSTKRIQMYTHIHIQSEKGKGDKDTRIILLL